MAEKQATNLNNLFSDSACSYSNENKKRKRDVLLENSEQEGTTCDEEVEREVDEHDAKCHVFKTVNIEDSLRRKPFSVFSPNETAEIEAKHISFEEVEMSTTLSDENTELQKVKDCFNLQYVFGKKTLFSQAYWSQCLDNCQENLYYIRKDTNNLALINRGKINGIAVLSKMENWADQLICRVYHLKDENSNEKILVSEQPASSGQQNLTVNHKSIEQLCCKTEATKSLVEYLNKNNITCNTKLVQRSVHSYFGVGLYFCADYNGEKAFVKLNCYRSFYQNEKVMNFLKNQTAKHLNKIMDFKVTFHSVKDLCGIFNLDESMINHLQLNGKIYLTVAESLTDWFSILPNMFVGQVPPKPTLSLIVKLMIDFLEGVKELHSMGIVHGDLSIMNCLLKISKDDGFPLDDLTEIKFHGVLADFNSSKLETQHFNSFEYFPITSHAPPDFKDFVQFGIEPKISYTKAHDIYALSFVITQLTIVLFKKRFNFVFHFSVIYQFLYETKNPKNSNWIIEEWDKLEHQASKLLENSESLIDIFAKLRHVICTMFENPWKVIEDAYFEKQINKIKDLLLEKNFN